MHEEQPKRAALSRPVSIEKIQGENRTTTVSVVVTAGGRRQFLGAALDSLSRQINLEVPPEVIVVAGFRDPGLEQVVAQLGGRWLDGDTPVGSALARGCQDSHGDLIAFLDDDDLFEPTKLSRAVGEFRAHPRLTYYHNAFTRVDERGLPLGRKPPAPRNRLLVSPDEVPSQYCRICKLNGAHNLSSIVVRRKAVLDQLTRLTRIQGATDRFMFYATAVSGGDMLLDSEPLTLYRVHSKSAIHSSLEGRDHMGAIAWNFNRIYETAVIIQDMLSESELGSEFAIELSAIRVKSHVLSGGQPKLTFEDLVRSVVFGLRAGDFGSALVPVLAGLPGNRSSLASEVLAAFRRHNLVL